RQPVEPVEALGVELDAILDQRLAVLVIGAAPVAPVEQLAGHVSRIEQPGLLILELVDAAASAAIAQRLPLAAVERRERAFPKWCPVFVGSVVHLKSSLALLSPANQAHRRSVGA